MAASLTPEENGRVILEIYAHFDSRPGHALSATNFLAVARRRRIPASDIQIGLDYAAEMKWIEENENGSLRLTEDGFAAMPPPHRAH